MLYFRYTEKPVEQEAFMLFFIGNLFFLKPVLITIRNPDTGEIL